MRTKTVKTESATVVQRPLLIDDTPSIDDEYTPGLTLPDIVRLLCSHAKSLHIKANPGDRRYKSNSLGIAALSALATSNGLDLGTAPIHGLLKDPPTRNPRYETTLNPIAALLRQWRVINPSTGNRIMIGADGLNVLHNRTYHQVSGESKRESLVRQVKEKISLVASVDSLTKILELVESHIHVLSIDSMLGNNTDRDSKISKLNSLLSASNQRYISARLYMVIIEDKAYTGHSGNADYVRSLLADAIEYDGLDLSDLAKSDVDEKINDLARAVGFIEDGKLPDSDDDLKELILLLALYAKKPYAENEPDRVEQFLGEWLDIPDIKEN